MTVKRGSTVLNKGREEREEKEGEAERENHKGEKEWTRDID